MAERSFGADSTTTEVADGIDLTGKLAIVTGASGGLGAETARVLASRGAAVTLAARDLAKAKPVAERIEAEGGSVEISELDLTSLASVRAFAARFLENHSELHILVNNAGIMAAPLGRTPEGWELHFATNHLGHFLLTTLLAPALEAGAPSRVVNVSSGAHQISGVDFDDLHFERRDYDKWAAYGQSKSANVLFTCELARRLEPKSHRQLTASWRDHDRARSAPDARRHQADDGAAGRRHGAAVQAAGGRSRNLRVGRHGAGARGQERALPGGLPDLGPGRRIGGPGLRPPRGRPRRGPSALEALRGVGGLAQGTEPGRARSPRAAG